VSEYDPGALVVCGPDFGHTGPPKVLPRGGHLTVDGRRQRITVIY